MGVVKTQDIPLELRAWWKMFERAAYRHDYSRVFDDFLTMTLSQFGPQGMFDEWHSQAMKPYDEKEKAAFTEMYFEMFRVFSEQVTEKDKPYYDMFGRMYETISSNYKKSGLGQFFTPEEVVSVIVDLQCIDLKTGGGSRILDPCSGSGRMLFIAHTKAPGNFQYGIDIDHVCVKMTALNMMLHGCVGEVVCGNGLFLDQDWRFGLSINPVLTHCGIPSIVKMEKDCSYIWSQWAHWEKGVAKKEKKKSSQLSIF